jgi:aminobenzoyl-glutamate transport protein
MQRLLDGIERLGNKMPSPAILFLWLCVGVIVLSQVLDWAGVETTYDVVSAPPVSTEEVYYDGSVAPVDVGPSEPVAAEEYETRTETATVQGLLTGEGVRFLFTSFVDNFRNFAAVAIILVVMIGVGLAEVAGLIAALIRRLVAVSTANTLTLIIITLGMISSVASDAGYLVLIPLGAAAFASVGRSPLAGIAAAFAGVSAGFGVNFLVAPIDSVLVEITNESSSLVDPGLEIDIVSNLFFSIASTVLVVIVCTVVTTRLVERRMGPYDPAGAGEGPDDPIEDAPDVAPEDEARGLRYALWATLAVVLAVGLLTVIPGAPLQDPDTGDVIGDTPFMDSLIVIIALIFLVAGLAFGRGAGTIKTADEAIGIVTKSWAGLAGLLLLFLLIAQFIAYFNFSNMAQVAAVELGDLLESADIGAAWLLLGFIFVTAIVNLIMPAAIAKWAILAPIFIPLFIRLDITPQTVLAAYRVGDAPTNVITPLMAYFPLIVIFVQRYQKSAGIGTVVSLMLPYVVALTIIWTLFFLGWYLLGIPLGPGAPVHP